MKGKILEELKNKYAHLGFSPKAFDGVAEFLSKTVTSEDQIETAVGGVELLLKAFQSETDKLRTEKSQIQLQLEELKKQQPANGGEQGGKNEPEKTFDAEAFKADLLKTFREEQAAAFQQRQQAAQRSAEVATKARKYGIPEKFAAKLNIAADADLDEYFKGVKQDMTDAGFEFSELPMQGGGISDNGNDIAKLIDTGTKQIVESKTN